jgi:hypothetical protein
MYFTANCTVFGCKSTLKTSLLSIQIQNTTRLYHTRRTLVTTNETAARKCLYFLNIGRRLLPSYAGLL